MLKPDQYNKQLSALPSTDSIPTPEEVASFYDGFGKRLLSDFIQGNLRVDAAVALVLRALDRPLLSVLDVGCGIGSSSHHIATKHRGCQVVGVDISPENIRIAKRLFESERLKFEVSDMTEVPPGGPFQAIVLLDVYEHIPRGEWTRFNELLASCLTDDGIVILTTPSPLHQQFLREHRPHKLQIIDETVQLADVVQLSKDLGALVTHYSSETVWKTNQYLHIVLERKPKFEKIQISDQRVEPFTTKILHKLNRFSGVGTNAKDREARRRLVAERLGIKDD